MIIGSSARPARSIERPVWHSERVHSVAQGDQPAPAIEEVSTSWQRSANTYRVNPDSSEAPRILTPRELGEVREPLDQLISSAREEIDRLYKVVREAGYVILFCDAAGVAVDHRGEDAESSRFKYWGTWLGGVWSEAIEGTNGIGTCIAEERPITVHRSQHYRSRHIDLSCSGAPVFDVDGRLMAVLDVSAVDPERSERAHALTGALTAASARLIEERYFREQFRREWIVAAAAPEQGVSGMLLAVDSGQRIVAANRAARISLLLDDYRLQTGVSLWSLFERDRALFGRKDTTDFPTRLVIGGSDETWPALVTPPESAAGDWQTTASHSLHARPRLDLVGALRGAHPPQQARGGLPSNAMRRVGEYVESNLGESIDLAALASIAGVSVVHFARAFKQSAGVTPHSYLVRRRVERAKEMLARTELSLAEVAISAGFSDQSHLARHFRHVVGVTPGQFRRLQR